MYLTRAGAALLGVALWAAPALVAQEAQPVVTTDALRVTLGGRLHTLLATTTVDGEPASQLLVRRARIEFEVELDERLSLEIVPEFAGRAVEVRNAYVSYLVSPDVEVRLGRAYRPFGLLEQTSSNRILPVERGLRIAGLDAVDEYAVTSGLDYSDRDLGLQVRGAPEALPLGMGFGFGVFRGPLHDLVADGHSYQVASRITLRPLPDVTVGAGWSRREFGALDQTSQGAGPRSGDAFEIDFEYGGFDPGLHVLVEVVSGVADPFTDAGFSGAQAWLGYQTLPRAAGGWVWEPILRVSYADVEQPAVAAVGSGGLLLTPGLNVHLGGFTRLMLNYDVWRGEGDSPDAGSFKAMLQVAF